MLLPDTGREVEIRIKVAEGVLLREAGASEKTTDGCASIVNRIRCDIDCDKNGLLISGRVVIQG